MNSSLRDFMPDRADRYFSGGSAQRTVARALFESVAGLPLICPHGHVDPLLFADAAYHFESPAELFLIPDHYVFRMLYSQGVPLEAQGVPMNEGEDNAAVESDHRKSGRPSPKTTICSKVRPPASGCAMSSTTCSALPKN